MRHDRMTNIEQSAGVDHEHRLLTSRLMAGGAALSETQWHFGRAKTGRPPRRASVVNALGPC